MFQAGDSFPGRQHCFQEVNNSSQVGSFTSQQGMNAGSAGAQPQAGSTFSQAVISPQAGNTSSQVGSTSPQPGRNAGNAGIQSQTGSISSRHLMLVLPREAPPRSPGHLPPKEERIHWKTPSSSRSLTYPANL